MLEGRTEPAEKVFEDICRDIDKQLNEHTKFE